MPRPRPLVTWLAAAAALSACLDDPQPAAVPDSAEQDTSVAGDTAEPDTDADSSVLVDTDGDTLAPPDPVTLAEGDARIRALRVLDANRDGLDDLVLLNLDGGAAEAGVYVAWGGAGFTPGRFDLHVATEGAALDLDLADLTGDGAPELVVLEHTGAIGLIEVFPGLDDAPYWEADAWRRDATAFGFTPDAGTFPGDQKPADIRVVAGAQADGRAALVATDLDEAWIIAPATWDAPGVIDAAVVALEPAAEWWDNVSEVFVTANVGGDAHYLVTWEQRGRLSFYPVEAGAGLSGTPTAVSLGFGQRGVARADVNADGVADLLGFDNQDLAAVVVTPPTATSAAYTQPPEGLASDFFLDDIVATDLGGSEAPEVFLLDNAAGGDSRSRLIGLRDLHVDGSLRTSHTPVELQLPLGVHPDRVVAGNLRGAAGPGVLLTWTATGGVACYDVDRDSLALTACD